MECMLLNPKMKVGTDKLVNRSLCWSSGCLDSYLIISVQICRCVLYTHCVLHRHQQTVFSCQGIDCALRTIEFDHLQNPGPSGGLRYSVSSLEDLALLLTLDKFDTSTCSSEVVFAPQTLQVLNFTIRNRNLQSVNAGGENGDVSLQRCPSGSRNWHSADE